ncbi:sn-glycerol-3-phosphate import ATP-binding protein [Nitratireductor pacificus pht-3B]|uniref:sn-glycerol-3-phosphate import ATP-binding protein n=1 Tax=Nitratireductor pacificus pht-3B TaxID=391937 RepID=K2N527_9HYPH|nr:sn-glycerol-3-phosphate import ATP-binding protein [Nitratireductor pacificus pht-3B]
MATISIRDITKSYGKTEVIHGVSLDVADGEFIVIVGPSGCGKSTLLRMVAGLERITGGTIDIGGRVVNELEPRERDIAMVFQNYALYPHMSVFDNMAYGLKIAGQSKAEIKARVDKAAAMLQLEPFLDRKPRALSGGQRQRVAMGRALVRQPSVFLFDEPLSNLDAKLRVQMRLEIKQMQRSVGTTALYVTHDQVEPRPGAPALRVPVRRAAVQSRRQAARADAPGDQADAALGGHHRALRDARPGGGDDAGRPTGGDERRHRRADRHADGRLRAAGDALRRRFHRLAGHEHPEGFGGRRGFRAGRRRAADACRGRARGSGPAAPLRRAAGASAARAGGRSGACAFRDRHRDAGGRHAGAWPALRRRWRRCGRTHREAARQRPPGAR